MLAEGLVLYVIIGIDLSYRAYTFKDIYIAIWVYTHIGLVSILFANFLTFIVVRNSLRLRSFYGKALCANTTGLNMVNLIGFYLTVRDRFDGENSLENSDYLELISFELLSSVYYGMALYIMMRKLLKYKEIKKRADGKRQFLASFYTHKQKPINLSYNQLMENHRELLSTFPLTKQESKLIQDLFSTKVFREDINKLCGICLNSFDEGAMETVIGCSHHFHLECLLSWYSVKPWCPFCKCGFREHLLKAYLKKGGS